MRTNLKKCISIIGFFAIAITSITVFSIAASGGRIFIGDDDESNYQSSPTITQEEAITIAENELNGIALTVELENEDGYLVYGVHVENADGLWDVKIDAGTGDVLKIEPDDD